MTAGCASQDGLDPTIQFVEGGYANMMQYAANSYGIATQTFTQLLNFHPDSQLVDVTYNFDDSLMGYVRPPQPGAFTFTLNLPGPLDPAPTAQAQRPAFDFNSPQLDATVPGLNYPPQPGPLTAADPGGPPLLFDVTIPPAPTLPDVTLPAMISILPLPLEPDIELPTFMGLRPVFDIPIPNPNVNFVPQVYSDALLDSTKALLATMQQGKTGLPASVEQALIDRAVGREDENAQRLLAETTDEFVTRGFSEPNGVLARRLLQVRQDNQNKRSTLSRDIYVKSIDVSLENLRFSVTQGVALEGILIANWTQMQTLILESQKLILQVAVEMTNVRVAVFNAQLAQYQTDASVFKELIAAELAKLEIFRAELEAKKLILSINAQEIEIYNAQLHGVELLIEVYKSQLEGVKLVVETNTLRLTGYQALVEAFSARVRAYQAQWEGYKAAVEGEGAKVQVFDTQVKAYMGEVQAWSAKNTSYAELGRFDIALDQDKLEEWKATLQKYLGDIQAQVSILQAETSAYDSSVRVYSAEAQVESAKQESDARKFELGMRREDNSAQIKLKNLELSIQELIQISQQLLEAKKTVAQGAGQLASAALSAVHFGASASTNMSNGTSCNTSYSFNTELLPSP